MHYMVERVQRPDVAANVSGCGINTGWRLNIGSLRYVGIGENTLEFTSPIASGLTTFKAYMTDNHKAMGYLDSIQNGDSVGGWACDPDADNKKCSS
jgi:hypothetical protein